MRNLLELRVNEIEEPVARDNFDRIQRFADEGVFNRFQGKHFEITFTKNVTAYDYPHGLGYCPEDVIQTSVRLPAGGTGTLTWNYDSFDRSNVNVTVAGLAAGETLVVRAFIGSYTEG